MTERVIIAGFGGQGIMMMGKLAATVGMHAGREVTFFPSYGAEVRGGTAHCHLVLSDEAIYSPVVERADTLIILNQPSYDKFRPRLKPDGLLLLNESMADTDAAVEEGCNVTCVRIPATQLANELGDVRVANVVMLGAWSALRGWLSPESIIADLEAQMTGRKAHLLDANRAAFAKGQELTAQLTKT